jgi:hypothetical protein
LFKYFELGDAFMNKVRLTSFAAWGRKRLEEDILKTADHLKLVLVRKA